MWLELTLGCGTDEKQNAHIRLLAGNLLNFGSGNLDLRL